MIDSVSNGECIMNTSQTILSGASFVVNDGKELLLPASLIIQ